MSETEEQAVHEIIMKLYGPKYCEHCQKVQPVITHVLEGSDYVKTSVVELKAGFTGSQTCSICYRIIEPTPEE
jgi:hypothetical protein